jgi:hypothetical protein
MFGMQLAQPDQTQVSEIGLTVGVTNRQFRESRQMFFEIQGRLDEAIAYEGQY